MKYIKYLIILFVIIIIIICTLLFNIVSTDNRNNEIGKNWINNTVGEQNLTIENVETENVLEDNDYNINVEMDNKLSYVDNRSDYFTVSALYNNYINLIGYKNKNTLKNVLSPEYITEYNVTDDNIFNILSVPLVENTKLYYKTNITEMLTTQIDSSINIYIVKGNCRIVGKNTKFSVQVMFEIDTQKNIYNTYPYQYIKDNGIDNLKDGDILNNYNKEEIEDRKNNRFNYVTKTDSEMAEEYFNHYSELRSHYQDEAYSRLNSEYAQRRFGSKENFQNHLKQNGEVLSLMQIDKYKVISTQNYTDYVCSDKYENIYIFRQQEGIMRYGVFLDNYTVMLEEYMEEYNQLDKFGKAKYNLTKFINMVNTKDYGAIYNVLDNLFKSNNFKTQSELNKFIKSNMYDLNAIQIDDADNESYEYYVFSCRIINRKDDSQIKKMTVVINQSEGTDFTMSFSFE